jgi:hypothetical protein
LPLIAEKWRAHGGAWSAQQQIGTKMPMLRGAQRVARGRSVSAALITGGGHESAFDVSLQGTPYHFRHSFIIGTRLF